MKTSKLSDAEFKIQVIRMFNELRGRVDELNEKFNRYKTKKDQLEMKNTIIQVKKNYRESTVG